MKAMVLGLIAGTLVFEARSSSHAQYTCGEAASPLSGAVVSGGGSWAAAGRSARSTQQWDIDAQRSEDGSLRGPVRLDGSPLMQSGVLEGRVVGRRVAGSISDEKGLHVATFVGEVTESGGLRGTYEDRTGEVGAWEWSGPLPK